MPSRGAQLAEEHPAIHYAFGAREHRADLLPLPAVLSLGVTIEMKTVPEVQCPTCAKKGDWFTGAFGPFCSKRCKLVDLGKWFNQEHAISEPLRPEHFEEQTDVGVVNPALDRSGPSDTKRRRPADT